MYRHLQYRHHANLANSNIIGQIRATLELREALHQIMPMCARNDAT
jgi:hypothetical protein